MERSTWIGIAVVATVGVGIAAGLALSMSPTAQQTLSSAAVPEDPPPPQGDLRVPTDPSAGRPSAAPDGAPAGVPVLVVPPRDPDAPYSYPPVDMAPGPDDDAPFEAPLADLPSPAFDEPFSRAEALMADTPFADLGAEPSPEEVQARVDAALAEIDAIAAAYEAVAAASPDPGLRTEAIELQAELYEQASTYFPIVTPTPVDGWEAQHTEISEGFRQRAAALRDG